MKKKCEEKVIQSYVDAKKVKNLSHTNVINIIGNAIGF